MKLRTALILGLLLLPTGMQADNYTPASGGAGVASVVAGDGSVTVTGTSGPPYVGSVTIKANVSNFNAYIGAVSAITFSNYVGGI